jgi:hypothetical protein
MKKEQLLLGSQEIAKSLAKAVSQEMPEILRDAWATFHRWHETGEKEAAISRKSAPQVREDLLLADAATRADAILFRLDNADWIILARHAARQRIDVPGGRPYAFPDPMITYVTSTPNRKGIAAGCYNLKAMPRWDDLQLSPGGSETLEGNARWLSSTDLTHEQRLLDVALRYFYTPQL